MRLRTQGKVGLLLVWVAVLGTVQKSGQRYYWTVSGVREVYTPVYVSAYTLVHLIVRRQQWVSCCHSAPYCLEISLLLFCPTALRLTDSHIQLFIWGLGA